MNNSRSYRQAIEVVSFDRPIRRKTWGERQFLITGSDRSKLLRQVMIEELPAGHVRVIAGRWCASDEDVRADDWQVYVLAKWRDVPVGMGATNRTRMGWLTDLWLAAVEALASV